MIVWLATCLLLVGVDSGGVDSEGGKGIYRVVVKLRILRIAILRNLWYNTARKE